MTFTHSLATNNYGPAKFIVATSAANGTHTTLASAMTAASSGDTIFLRDSVTENVTITPGVNIAAWTGGSLNTPSITGKLTMTGAGTSTISGIKLITNSDFFLAVTGSAASIVNLFNCYLNCSNNTGISFTSSNTSAAININYCNGDIGTTLISLFAQSSTGTLSITYTNITNSGVSTTASTNSAGTTLYKNSRLAYSTTTSSTSSLEATLTDFPANQICLTLNGTTGNSNIRNCIFASASNSAISVGAGVNSQITKCMIASTNTNPITGAGTVSVSEITFLNTGIEINATSTGGDWTQLGRSRAVSQPAFSAVLSGTQNNKTGNGTGYTVICDTETYDIGSNYNNTTGTFTAPVTGKYMFIGKVYMTGCTVASSMRTAIVTTARIYNNNLIRAAGNQDFIVQCTALADMTAGQTCNLQVIITGEAADTDDVLGDGSYTTTFFQGYLVC